MKTSEKAGQKRIIQTTAGLADWCSFGCVRAKQVLSCSSQFHLVSLYLSNFKLSPEKEHEVDF